MTGSLDRLGEALALVGLASASRYGSSPPQLLVFYRVLPSVGESITVAPNPDDGEPWFQSSSGALVAPCADVPMAVGEIAMLLAPVWAAAARLARSGPA